MGQLRLSCDIPSSEDGMFEVLNVVRRLPVFPIKSKLSALFLQFVHSISDGY